jgi:hypothetical protein
MANRLVRFLEAFFDDLDRQLPAERGADGTPSATDFPLYDLPPIRDALAVDFKGVTTEIRDTAPLRVFLGTGTLVRASPSTPSSLLMTTSMWSGSSSMSCGTNPTATMTDPTRPR